MGEDIAASSFDQEQFDEYLRRLEAETTLLEKWIEEEVFAEEHPVGGFEIESWLVGPGGEPLPINERFLEHLDNSQVVAELSKYNVEINTPPPPLEGATLTRMQEHLTDTLRHCRHSARAFDAELLMVGILPTLEERHLTLENMSSKDRFKALNEQIFKLRKNRPIELDIEGRDHLRTAHQDVMLEAAATSFQIHIQVPQHLAVRYYNASMVISAPMVALTANSPFLFGHDLWDETRIPLFEQAVSVAEHHTSRLNRVTFGSGYLRESLAECFQENLHRHSVLLPIVSDCPPQEFRHLRLLNGTIWRWNRPLVGFDPAGRPHLRVEHRTAPAGPSLVDTLANAAFYFGLVHTLANRPVPPEIDLPFQQARDNFYSAAKDGLRSEVTWLNGRYGSVHELLWSQLLPLAEKGLVDLGLDIEDIKYFLYIIEARLRSGQNGASWQRKFAAAHGNDMNELTRAYRENQRSGAPVHEWKV